MNKCYFYDDGHGNGGYCSGASCGSPSCKIKKDYSIPECGGDKKKCEVNAWEREQLYKEILHAEHKLNKLKRKKI